MGFSSTAQKSGRTFLLMIAALCVLGIAFLAKEVARDLELLSSADSDNVQWTLSQAEVEFLEFKGAVDTSAVSDVPELLGVRIEFDIFYSRIETLNSSGVYSKLREDPYFSEPLDEVKAFLEASIPIIDASDEELLRQLPTLVETTETTRTSVRDLATAGLSHFAVLSDARRTSVWGTLLRLAVLTAALILALGLLARHANQVTSQTRRRGQELAAAYSRLNTILETSLDAVIVADMEGRILEFNEAAERIFQRRFVEVVGRRVGDIIVPENMRAAHEAGVQRMHDDVHAEGHILGKGRVQLEALRSSGEVFPVEVALEMAEADGDRIMIAFVRDISHRVAAEKELIEARDRALAGEKAKADFLAVMTHEIRTPLNGVLGNLALLEETSLSTQQARYVHNMSVSGKLLMHHVDAVLDIARFESGKMVLSNEPVHLGRLLQETVDGQHSAAVAKGNALSWSWVGEPVSWVEADPSRLQQILLNLVGNAIKFTDNGSITIEAEQYQVKSLPGITNVELRIIDTGVGIAEDYQARIFEDFQTSDAGFARKVGGTGLGLGIARRFAQAMGGEIGVESAEGEGSVFWLRLPFPIADAPETSGTTEAETVTGSPSYEVLVVEDNEINLMVVREMLEGLGQRVSEADNGLKAVELAQDTRFDLILMDISMPIMDGLEAARTIRAGDGASKEQPIVALSANVLPEAKDRFIAAGMSGFLSKPLRKDELRAVIDGLDSLGETLEEAPAADDADSAISKEIADETRAQLGDAVYEKLRTRFAGEAAELIAWLREGPTDTEELAQRCHKIAGSAAVFGAMTLRDALVQVEDASERGALDEAQDHIRQVLAIWGKLEPELRLSETV